MPKCWQIRRTVITYVHSYESLLPIGHIAEEVKINVLDTTVIVAKDAFVVPLQAAQPGSQERIKTSTLLHNKNKSFVDPYPFPSFVLRIQ